MNDESYPRGTVLFDGDEFSGDADYLGRPLHFAPMRLVCDDSCEPVDPEYQERVFRIATRSRLMSRLLPGTVTRRPVMDINSFGDGFFPDAWPGNGNDAA